MEKLGFHTGVNVYLMKRSPRNLSRSPRAVQKINLDVMVIIMCEMVMISVL